MLASSRVKATGPPRTPLALSVRLFRIRCRRVSRIELGLTACAVERVFAEREPRRFPLRVDQRMVESAGKRAARLHTTGRADAQPVECWGVDAKAHAVARLAEAAVEFGHVAGDVQLRFALAAAACRVAR